MPHGPTKATAKKTPDGAQGARQKRNRRKKGDAGLKPGKQSWIFGTKLVFFAARAQEWKDANANGNLGLGEFYTKITNLYALKYGYEMADHEDLAEDKPDPTDPDAEILGSADLTEEEAAERSATHLQIRKRIAAWYCRTYRGLDAREKNIFTEIMAGIESTGPSYPKRAQPIHFYSRKYYEEKVKARFEARWATEVQRAKDLEMPEPEAIKIRNAVTKEVFEEETPEFQAELKLAVEAEHVAAVRAWELTSSQAETKTPQEMNAALKNAAYYLEPLANAIRDKFLLNCTILVCGPMGDRGGAIEVRSVHAGTTRGLAPRKWYQSDPAGYDATERCFVKFTEKCFSDEDCLARTVGVEQVGATTSGVSATGVRAPGESPGAGSSGRQALMRVRKEEMRREVRLEAASGGTAPGAQGGDPGGDEGGDAQGGTAGGTAGRAQGGDPGGDAQGGAAGGTSGGTAPGAQGGDQGSDQGGAGGSDDDDDMGEAFYTARDEFGGVWGDCVDAWLELENASGCNNEGGQLTMRERPAAVTEFISGGRKWEWVREITYVGTKAEEGTYVAKWWAWWAQIAGGGDLAKMHGRTEFMLVLGSLLWWGVKQRGAEWEEAAKTVTAQLKETVESGEIVKKTRLAPKGKQPKRKHAERDESDDEEEEEEEEEAPSRYVMRKRRKAEESEKRQTRGQAAAAPKTVAAKKAAGRCSQDEARKKKLKASQNPDTRNRDYVGMKRYRCESHLSISCQKEESESGALTVTVKLKHSGKHVSYLDVSMPPEALAMIQDNVQWLTPGAMVTKVQAAFPVVTRRASTELGWR
ncbi:hypothetical protein C8F04DRAFT_1263801 [Mycena alexandri]|uniref:Uncharacterized protein n=1 Tax=Mycena alexandri TaxID=1745969 RepID=A0AAD6X0P1_9AGAR|nr:hypothetical protein C8F04DRAFT_1263801 [Mycena alexandri]